MNQATSEGHLFKLVADTSLPEIARATAVYYLGSHQTREAAEVLLKSIRDKHTLVRYHACRSLENFPPELWIGRASAGLNDPVRAVRIAAADLYNIVPRESIPAAALGAFDRADQENRAYLNYQTDFSVGNVMLADYHLQRGNNSEAVLWYERGLKKDSLLNVARLNLAVAYNLTSRNAEALRVLETAAAIEPNSDRILYNIALLQVEMNDDEAAARSFQQALILGTAIDGVYYNYGLFLQGNGKDKEAEQVFLTGKKRCPNALNLDYALAYFYVMQKKTNQARPYAYRLWQADRNNRNYAEIFALFNFQS
jgi:Tfp pilus assembly protein PilF